MLHCLRRISDSERWHESITLNIQHDAWELYLPEEANLPDLLYQLIQNDVLVINVKIWGMAEIRYDVKRYPLHSLKPSYKANT